MQFFVKNRCYVVYLSTCFAFVTIPGLLVSADNTWFDSCVLGETNEDNPILLKNFSIEKSSSEKRMYRKVFGMFRGYLGSDCMLELCDCFNKNLETSLKEKKPSKALENTFCFAEKTIKENNCKSAATALVVLVPDDDTLVIANVGSCCAMRFWKNNNKKDFDFLCLAHDFKNWSERGRIEEAGASIVPIKGELFFLGAIPVTRAFGFSGKYDCIKPYPEIISYTIKEYDKALLIGTTEFFDCFSMDELLSIFDENEIPGEICLALKNALNEKIKTKKKSVLKNIAFAVLRPILRSNVNVVKKFNETVEIFNSLFSNQNTLEGKITAIYNLITYIKTVMKHEILVYPKKFASEEFMLCVNQQTSFEFFDVLATSLRALKMISKTHNNNVYNLFKEFDGILKNALDFDCFSGTQKKCMKAGREKIQEWFKKIDNVKK